MQLDAAFGKGKAMTGRLTEQDLNLSQYDDMPKDWTKSTSHADFLDKLADDYEREGMPEHAPRLREDAAWYRARFRKVEMQ